MNDQDLQKLNQATKRFENITDLLNNELVFSNAKYGKCLLDMLAVEPTEIEYLDFETFNNLFYNWDTNLIWYSPTMRSVVFRHKDNNYVLFIEIYFE